MEKFVSDDREERLMFYLSQNSQLQQLGVQEKGMSPGDMIESCILLMQTCEDFHDMTGPEKRTLIIKVFVRWTEDTMIEGFQKQCILFFIENILPSLISTVVDLDKGKVKIHLSKLYSGCLPCGSKTRRKSMKIRTSKKTKRKSRGKHM